MAAAPHVLIVDADASYASSLASAFAAQRCRASARADAASALALAATDRPALVVIAAELPGASGLVACNKFKRDASLKNVPVLVLAGNTPQGVLDEHAKNSTAAQAYVPRATPAGEVAEQGRELIERFPAAKPPAAAPPPPAAAPTPEGTPAEELRILDDEIERRTENHEWPEAIAALERRLQRVADRGEKVATLEKLLPIYELETINGPETIRAAERLLLLVPDHAAAVASLRRAYTRRKDHDRLAELDAHLARVKKG